MGQFRYQVVRHQHGWAYHLEETYSPVFPTSWEAIAAAKTAAHEKHEPGDTTTVRVQEGRLSWRIMLVINGSPCPEPVAGLHSEPNGLRSQCAADIVSAMPESGLLVSFRNVRVRPWDLGAADGGMADVCGRRDRVSALLTIPIQTLQRWGRMRGDQCAISLSFCTGQG